MLELEPNEGEAATPSTLAVAADEAADAAPGPAVVGRWRHGGAHYLDSSARRAARTRAPVRSPRLDGLQLAPLRPGWIAAYCVLWLLFVMAPRAMAYRHLLDRFDPDPPELQDEYGGDHGDDDMAYDHGGDEPGEATGAAVARAYVPPRRRMPPPEMVAPLPGLGADVATHIDKLQVLGAALGYTSVTQVIGMDCDAIGDVHDEYGQPLLTFADEPTDIRPYVRVKQARIPSARAVIDIECHEGKLYEITTFARSKEAWIPRWQAALGAPARRVDYPEGGSLLEWKQPYGMVRMVTMEPETKDRMWIVMAPGREAAFPQQEDAILHAMCLNDMASSLARGRRPSKDKLRRAAALYEQAIARSPTYRKAHLRLCDVLVRLGEPARARAACDEAAKSNFPEVREKAWKLLEKLGPEG